MIYYSTKSSLSLTSTKKVKVDVIKAPEYKASDFYSTEDVCNNFVASVSKSHLYTGGGDNVVCVKVERSPYFSVATFKNSIVTFI
jgi:hypothetical protein